MRIFLFKLNYEDPRSSRIVANRVGIIKAPDFDAAREKVWKLYGADNASFPAKDIIDITGREEASIYMPVHKDGH